MARFLKDKPMRLLFFVAITIFISGCASLPNTQIMKIDKHQIEYKLSENGTNIVVFENGLDGTLGYWSEVYPQISKDNTAFAYNRSGYGKSDLVSTPRDGKHIVEELRTLLQSKGLKPPYILVGHSLGGLYMQLFARKYPQEVQALILVDTTHPKQFQGAGSTKNWPSWLKIGFNVITAKVAKMELESIDSTGEEVLSLPTFKDKPVIILSALKPMSEHSTLANDANEKRKDILNLYPNATQIWVDSGHGIPLEVPQSIIDAINKVKK